MGATDQVLSRNDVGFLASGPLRLPLSSASSELSAMPSSLPGAVPRRLTAGGRGALGSLKVWPRVHWRVGDGLPGCALADCDPIKGDTISGRVTWKGSSDVSPHAGKIVRLRFVMNEADIFSLKFDK